MSTSRASDVQPHAPATRAARDAAVDGAAAVASIDVDTCLRACAAAHGRAPTQADLLPLLLAVQARAGVLLDAHLHALADALNLSRAEVHGVASFYPDLRHLADPSRATGNAPRMDLCAAESCQARGANELLRHVRGDARVRSVYCLGNCACGPSARVGDRVFANLTVAGLDSLLASLADGEQAGAPQHADDSAGKGT